VLSLTLAKQLAKHLSWEPRVGDLTIVFGEAGEEIIEPIISRHERERKIVLSLREMGELVWLPRLGRLLDELRIRVKKDFVLGYIKESNQWYYKDDSIEIFSDTPEDASGQALLKLFESRQE